MVQASQFGRGSGIGFWVQFFGSGRCEDESWGGCSGARSHASVALRPGFVFRDSGVCVSGFGVCVPGFGMII